MGVMQYANVKGLPSAEELRARRAGQLTELVRAQAHGVQPAALTQAQGARRTLLRVRFANLPAVLVQALSP
jgi:hypothetical protein